MPVVRRGGNRIAARGRSVAVLSVVFACTAAAFSVGSAAASGTGEVVSACPSWAPVPGAPTTTTTATTTPTTTTALTTSVPLTPVAAPMVASGGAVDVPGSTLAGPSAARLTASLAGAGAGGSVSIVAEYWQTGAAASCTAVRTTSASTIEIPISGLDAATRYLFRFATNSAAGATLGKTGSFSTLPAGRIAEGVTVGEVHVGRLTQAAAVTALEQSVAAPVSLTYEGARWKVAPGRLGAKVDAKQAAGLALGALPGAQLPRLEVSVERPLLEAYVGSLSRRWAHAPVPTTVRLVGTQAVVTAGHPGVALQRNLLAAQLAKQLVRGTRSLLPLPVRTTHTVKTKPQKAVVVRLATQTLTAYLNGKPVLTTPVTTGRPALPTPIGSFSVQFRASPYVFHSPWAPGSPYWYPPTPVTWAMEFYDGDFLHDDPAEPSGDFGSDSNDGYFASHGCVHVPHDAMAFLYNWLPVGAPVIVAER